jgi:hypothetical protein
MRFMGNENLVIIRSPVLGQWMPWGVHLQKPNQTREIACFAGYQPSRRGKQAVGPAP